MGRDRGTVRLGIGSDHLDGTFSRILEVRVSERMPDRGLGHERQPQTDCRRLRAIARLAQLIQHGNGSSDHLFSRVHVTRGTQGGGILSQSQRLVAPGVRRLQFFR